jgi:predicted AlkP superfamily pyrophosphatase or phosphodiesterase
MVNMTDSLGLPVNYIFVSDHGMTTVDTLYALGLPKVVDTVKFIVSPGEGLLHLYAHRKKYIRHAYKALKKDAVEYHVYLPGQTPARWHYSKKDDWHNRIGDILLVSKLPRVFNLGNKPVSPGKHGFDNALPDMQASFYAWGPAFAARKQTDAFENIHVYPLIAGILGLTISEKIDGAPSVLQNLLR